MDDWDLKDELPNTDFEYHKADLSDSSWTELVAGKVMQVVSALEVLEHMIDTVKFVNDCSKITAHGGYLAITTPNINSLRNRIMVPLGKYPAGMEYTNVIHHVRLFNVNAVTELLEHCGYAVLAVSGVSFLPERYLKYDFIEKISKLLARLMPSLCNNLIIIARKSDAA